MTQRDRNLRALGRRALAATLIVLILGALVYRLAHDRTFITKYRGGAGVEESKK